METLRELTGVVMESGADVVVKYPPPAGLLDWGVVESYGLL